MPMQPDRGRRPPQISPGDFFADPLPHADVLIMGHILHDWNLDEKRMLLGEGLRRVARRRIADRLRRNHRRRPAGERVWTSHELNMLIEGSGGFDYTGADRRAWMAETGFSETYVEHLVGPTRWWSESSKRSRGT